MKMPASSGKPLLPIPMPLYAPMYGQVGVDPRAVRSRESYFYVCVGGCGWTCNDRQHTHVFLPYRNHLVEMRVESANTHP